MLSQTTRRIINASTRNILRNQSFHSRACVSFPLPPSTDSASRMTSENTAGTGMNEPGSTPHPETTPRNPTGTEKEGGRTTKSPGSAAATASTTSTASRATTSASPASLSSSGKKSSSSADKGSGDKGSGGGFADKVSSAAGKLGGDFTDKMARANGDDPNNPPQPIKGYDDRYHEPNPKNRNDLGLNAQFTKNHDKNTAMTGRKGTGQIPG